MPPRGYICAAASPRCIPGDAYPSWQGRKSLVVSKTDRAYGEVFSAIRKFGPLYGTFTSYELAKVTGLERKRLRNALKRMFLSGELEVAREEVLRGRYLLRHFRFANKRKD